VLLLALGSLLAMMVMAGSASASHVRPANATPMNMSLVPAFTPCAAPDGKHGTPLAANSCSSVSQVSNWLTIGTPEVNGLGSVSQAAVKLRVFCNQTYPYAASNPTHPSQLTGVQPPCSNASGLPAGDQEDVSIEVCAGGRCQFPTGPAPAGTTDTRCKVATGVGTPCNSGAATPYNGLVVGTATIQITDHYNALTGSPPGCSTTTSCTGTVAPLPFSVGAVCSAGNCKYLTTADAVVPDTVKENKKAVVEIGQLLIFDGGSSGTGLDNPLNPGHCPPACIPNVAGGATQFAVQGIFLP